MAIQSRILYEDKNELQNVTMGFEWEDSTNLVTQFIFVIKAGNRGATFTLTRLSDGAVRSHDFTPGSIRTWNPPFNMPVTPFLNPKTGLIVGIPNGWTAELALD